jgi:hypothetical protein
MAKVTDMVAKATGEIMPQAVDWTERAKGLLKSELKKRNVTYGQLVEKLAEIGVKDTDVNIRNKIARGGFTAVFLIQCLEAIGCRTLHVGEG